MADYSRIRRQQLLREAEGYLDFVSLFPDQWDLSSCNRDRLVERSLEMLERVQVTNSNRALVLYLKGHAYRLMERWGEALEPLKASSEENPENLATWLALAWCYKRLGRLHAAIESLETALSVDDQEAIIYYNLACYWALTQNVPRTIFYLSQAFDLDPTYRDRVSNEADFDPVRKDPHFEALVSKVIV